jgi:uncharacterized caspase-like protein
MVSNARELLKVVLPLVFLHAAPAAAQLPGVHEGQPALKFHLKGGRVAFVKYDERDREPGLRFLVTHYHAPRWKGGCQGHLYVTANRIAFEPTFSPKYHRDAFNVPRDQVKKAKAHTTTFQGLFGIQSEDAYIQIDIPNRDYIFRVTVEGGAERIMIRDLSAGPLLAFMERAIGNFETAQEEFSQLTATLRGSQSLPLGTSATLAISPPPMIEIMEPAEEMRAGSAEIPAKALAVRGKARDSLGVFSVTINGRPAGTRALDSETVEFWLEDVLLKPGPNDIVIVATNTARQEKTLTFTVRRPEVELPASASATPLPDRWALVVGISRYGPAAQEVGDLKYARRDADAFYEFLRSPQGGGFPDDHVLLLTDEQATSSNLRGGIRDFLGRAGENDLVVIFFAGHGTPDPARPSALYLLTYDSDLERLGATAFDMEEIQLALRKNIAARRVVAFVDACHSAGVGTVLTARSLSNRMEVVNRYLHELARSRPGVVMLTASQTNEPSWEDERWGGGHGVFTHFLLEGLRGGADRDSNRIVTLQELIDFISDRVKQETDYKQHPTASTSAVWDPELPLAVRPRQ